MILSSFFTNDSEIIRFVIINEKIGVVGGYDTTTTTVMPTTSLGAVTLHCWNGAEAEKENENKNYLYSNASNIK